MTRASDSTRSQPRRRVLDAGTKAPLDKITRIMAELTLDHQQRDALARHLDRVGVLQLVRGDPPSHASAARRVV